MSQQNDRVVAVLPAADATPAGDGRLDSAGPSDLQRLVIDIGDNKTIEITLRGKLTLQSIGVGEGEGGTGTTSRAAQLGSPEEHGTGTTSTAVQLEPPEEHGTVPSENAVEDAKFLEQMRGWLMTVATLFVGISFQVAMQPPSWITPDWYDGFLKYFRLRRSSAATAHAPSPAGATAATLTPKLSSRAFLHVFFNTLTLAISLTLVVLMLWMKKSPPPHAMAMVRVMTSALCFFVGLTFLASNSYGPDAARMVFIIFVLYCLGALCFRAQARSINQFVLRVTRRGGTTNHSLSSQN